MIMVTNWKLSPRGPRGKGLGLEECLILGTIHKLIHSAPGPRDRTYVIDVHFWRSSKLLEKPQPSHGTGPIAQKSPEQLWWGALSLGPDVLYLFAHHSPGSFWPPASHRSQGFQMRHLTGCNVLCSTQISKLNLCMLELGLNNSNSSFRKSLTCKTLLRTKWIPEVANMPISQCAYRHLPVKKSFCLEICHIIITCELLSLHKHLYRAIYVYT